jgi:hypothetical protein
MALVCQYRTVIGLRSVDLVIMSVEAAFVAEAGVFAVWDLTKVSLAVFFFVLSKGPKSGIWYMGQYWLSSLL